MNQIFEKLFNCIESIKMAFTNVTQQMKRHTVQNYQPKQLLENGLCVYG